jgi:transcriptional regulator with XRE-family HTH domain
VHTSRPLTLGQQLREARVRARLKPKDLARKAGVSLAALYNCERADRGGRTKTLIALALALGLAVRVPDLPALAAEQGLTEAKLAEISGLAFATVRSALRRPESGNVKTLERVTYALGERVTLVV